MKIFGLDCSYHRTGWAEMDGCNLIDYGCIIPPDEYKKVTFKDTKFSKFLHWYSNVIKFLVKDFEPEVIAMEDINIRFLSTGKALQQIQAAAKIGIVSGTDKLKSIRLIHNSTIKSVFGIKTHKDQISKEINTLSKIHKIKTVKIQSVLAINKKFHLDLPFEQNDEADAISICYTALKKELEDGIEE
jgi:Holliday junction resolvasome RuvABC endonuclease subunit